MVFRQLPIGGRNSVPHALCDSRVWTETAGDDEIIIVSGNGTVATEVARRRRVVPGESSKCDDPFPSAATSRVSGGPGDLRAEEQYLALGEGATRRGAEYREAQEGY